MIKYIKKQPEKVEKKGFLTKIKCYLI